MDDTWNIMQVNRVKQNITPCLTPAIYWMLTHSFTVQTQPELFNQAQLLDMNMCPVFQYYQQCRDDHFMTKYLWPVLISSLDEGPEMELRVWKSVRFKAFDE